MKRTFRVVLLLALGLMVSNCSKCGEIFGQRIPGLPNSCGSPSTPSG